MEPLTSATDQGPYTARPFDTGLSVADSPSVSPSQPGHDGRPAPLDADAALSQITLEGALTSGELAARTGLTTGATTLLIDRLERAGFVYRTADPDDRRKVIVEPVADSLGRIESVVGPARRQIAEILTRYTSDQRAVLFDYFAHATPAFRAATEEIRDAAAHRRQRNAGAVARHP